MVRESVKHGPERDEAFSDEARHHRGEFEEGMAPDATSSTARDDQEARAELADSEELPGEPMPPVTGARPSPAEDPAIGPGEAALREELLGAIRDASFPATRNDLLRHVGPDSRGPLQGHLRALPPDLVFGRPEDVVTAFGGLGDAE